jgi:hypothetical protein
MIQQSFTLHAGAATLAGPQAIQVGLLYGLARKVQQPGTLGSIHLTFGVLRRSDDAQLPALFVPSPGAVTLLLRGRRRRSGISEGRRDG